MHRALILLALLMVLTATPLMNSSFAQFDFGDSEEGEEEGVNILNPYDEQYRPAAQAGANSSAHHKSPVPKTTYLTYIRNAVTGRAGDFSLTLNTVGNVYGCVDVQAPTLSQKFSGKKMVLEITNSLTSSDKSHIAYSHYSCDIKGNSSLATFIMNRDDFLSRDIKKIFIEEENVGRIAEIDVEMDEVKALFTPRYPINKTLFTDHEKEKHTVYFFPPNTLSLFNNAIDLNDKDTYVKLSNFAQINGLTLLEHTNPGFERLQKRTKNALLVVDTHNKFASEFEDIHSVLTMGEVETNELFTGPEGDYMRPKKRSIFARLAGAQ